MRTPEKASDVGAFAFPRTTKPRRYDYGGAATFPFGGYRPGLRSVVGARYCPPGGPRRGRAGDHRGEAERQAQRGLVAWSPEVIAALADGLVGVAGPPEREGSPNSRVLDLCAFESLPGARSARHGRSYAKRRHRLSTRPVQITPITG